MTWKELILDTKAGDRASAYTPSNKILETPQGLLCTWINAQRINVFALISQEGEVIRRGQIGGQMIDNHCGAALALRGEEIHVLLGGHHSPLEHWVLEDLLSGQWRKLGEINAKATYPALISDSTGRLHASYRIMDNPLWTLGYSVYDATGWSEPRELIRAEKEYYIYWTNTLSIDHTDHLHLAFSMSLMKEESIFYSAGTLRIDPSGQAISPAGIPLPDEASLRIIEALYPVDDSFLESPEHQSAHDAPGPLNLNYYQINLSNLIINELGQRFIVFHHVMTGEAWLIREDQDEKSIDPLTPLCSAAGSGYRIHAQSSLTFLSENSVRIALMIESTEEHEWGAPGTFIELLDVDLEGKLLHRQIIKDDSPAQRACWLPALAHPQSPGTLPPKALLYTCGHNAGGFDQNENEEMTEVRLLLF